MLQYIVLGIIQGLTEFFPVSSSGHLVLIQALMHMSEHALETSIILHLGTLLSLFVFFFHDIIAVFRDRKLLACTVLTTAVTGAIGIAGKDFFEQFFNSPQRIGISLLITGGILWLTKRFMDGKRANLTFKDAMIIGITQGIAIIPGISRSGITIATLLFRGMERQVSFRYSFVVSIPAIIGATLLEFKDIHGVLQGPDTVSLAAGFSISFFTGITALSVLQLMVRKSRLHYIGYYCLCAGLAALMFIRQ